MGEQLVVHQVVVLGVPLDPSLDEWAQRYERLTHRPHLVESAARQDRSQALPPDVLVDFGVDEQVPIALDHVLREPGQPVSDSDLPAAQLRDVDNGALAHAGTIRSAGCAERSEG